jgi:opacity protein-like surface antigen
MNRLLFYLLPYCIIGITFAEGGDSKESYVHPTSSVEINNHSIAPLSQGEQPQSSMRSLYLQFNTSGLFSLLKDWKNQNLLPDGTNPATLSTIFGAECGYVINKYVQLGIGYEFFFTTKVTTQLASGDQINSTFFYGSIKAKMPLESVSDLSLFAGLDIGSMKVTEVLENYDGLDFDRGGSTTGYRVMLGAQYFLVDNWSIMASSGYLFGKVIKVTTSGQDVVGQVWPNYSLDLSGFIIRFAVNYHIPL